MASTKSCAEGPEAPGSPFSEARPGERLGTREAADNSIWGTWGRDPGSHRAPSRPVQGAPRPALGSPGPLDGACPAGHPAGAGGGGSRWPGVGLMCMETTTELALSASGFH